MWLISSAYAQAAPAASGTSDFLSQLPMLLGIGVVFWFFLLRPQKKAAEAQKALLAGVRRGDRIAMKGGLLGKVVRVHDAELTLEIAEGVRVQVERAQLDRIIAKTEAVKGDKVEGDEEVEGETEAVAPDAPAKPQSVGDTLKGFFGGKKD